MKVECTKENALHEVQKYLEKVKGKPISRSDAVDYALELVADSIPATAGTKIGDKS